MIFVSLVDVKPAHHEKRVFCIEVDEPLMKHLRDCIEFFKSRKDLKECQLSIDTYRARFFERDDYDEVMEFPPDPLCGEDALGYYNVMWDNGKPTIDYWDMAWDTPKELQVWLTPNGIGFTFTDRDYKRYETHGMNWDDFLKVR